IVIDFESIRTDYAGHTETLQSLLATRVASIPTTTLKRYKSERCRYIDARKAGYTINKALPGAAVDSLADPKDKVELQISRANTG
ncbi:hypothetical protein ACXWN3_09460, partial [Streptococcus pyogenes]